MMTRDRKGRPPLDRQRPAAIVCNAPAGFTLMESLLAVVLIATSIFLLAGFAVGSRQIDDQRTLLPLAYFAQAKMEELFAMSYNDFAAIGSDADAVTVNGTSYARTWTVSAYDPDIKQVMVVVGPVQLMSLRKW